MQIFDMKVSKMIKHKVYELIQQEKFFRKKRAKKGEKLNNFDCRKLGL